MYYYTAKLITAHGHTYERKGVIPAVTPEEAMDVLEEMAEAWASTIQSARLHEVNEDGEIVLMTVKEPGCDDTNEKKMDKPKPVWDVPLPMVYPAQFGKKWKRPTFTSKIMEETK